MRLPRRRHGLTEAELAAYADGSLPAERRARVAEVLASCPQLRAEVEAHRRVLAAIDQAAAERAPSTLRARLTLAHPPGHKPKRRPAWGLVPAGALAAAVAAAVLALTGGVAPPTVVQASLLASRLPQAPVGEPTHGSGSLPHVRASGLTYPYWEDRFGFKAAGVRRDQVGGRRVTVVYYSRGLSRVAYGIVSGPPLRLGAAAGGVVRQGVWFRTLRTRGGMVVTWTRASHTCVLTGTGTSVPVLLHLASWREGGRVPY